MRWRRGALLVVVPAACAAAAAAPGPGAARPAASRPAVSVRLAPTSLSRVLVRSRVRLRLRTRRTTFLRSYALVRGAAGGGSSVVATRTRTLRLRARRTRTISLRLIGAGRQALGGCGARTIEARALVLHGSQRVPGRSYRARRVLRARAAGCAAPRPMPYSAPDAARCDVIDPAVCLQPFPNDLFTVPDRSTATGRRVSLDEQSMPVNQAGKPIDPGDINRNDGFSPGSPIVTRVPGLDNARAFSRTGAVPITDLARTFDPRQPVLVINTRTLRRQLIWAEIDSNPKDPANVNLIIRPAVNLAENTRYVVALRNLRDAAGRVLEPGTGFRIYRDRILTSNDAIEARRAHFESIFDTLARAGVDRDSLYRAWDFTVASERSLSERQLAIRDDAFRQLGDTNLADLKVQGSAPAFQVTKVTDFSPDENAKIGRKVEGTYTVPCYLNLPGCPSGSRFSYPSATAGVPQWTPGNTMQARFTCNIPRIALQSGGARPSLYGHGLFGSRGEIDQDQLQSMAQEHDFVFCATDWVGMSCTDLPPSSPDSAAQVFADLIAGHPRNPPDCDVPNAFTVETDLSNFPTLVDRLEQAYVNFMYLGRLMIHPQGFVTNSSFQNAAGQPLIDTTRLFYDGNSQGGIFGGALIALEPDLDRGVIGVSGMNYSFLLQRSSDFGTGEPPHPDPTDPSSVIPEFAYPLYQAYPNELERQLILSLIQQMWDHSDSDGLAAHMTSDPLPNTPAHTVLMQIGLGDHQVSQYAAEIEARTIGAHARLPWADRGRYSERNPTFGLAPITRFPFSGSAIVLWDIGPARSSPCPSGESQCGTPPPPTTNTPPSQGEDPHEFPRRSAAARLQKSEFLRVGGRVIEVCGSRPCYAGAWTGP